MPVIKIPRVAMRNKFKLALTATLWLQCFVSFSQEFGCFSEPMSSNYYSKVAIGPSLNYDSIFWMSYSVPAVTDGYYIAWWNKYQKKMEGTIKDGKREGPWKLYQEDANCFFKINFVHDVKEGDWGYYCISMNDTIQNSKGNYKNDLKDGAEIWYHRDTIIGEIRNFEAGKQEGQEISYAFSADKMKYIQSLRTDSIMLEYKLDDFGKPFLYRMEVYKNTTPIGKIFRFSSDADTLEIREYAAGESYGTVILKQQQINGTLVLLEKKIGNTTIEIDYSDDGDTTEIQQYSENNYGTHTLFKLDSTDMKWKINKTITYSKYGSDGVYKQYYNNGQLAYELEIKSGLPYNALGVYSKDGRKLDAGSLKEGNGVMNFFYPNGAIKSSCTYNNSRVKGKLMTYYESGTVDIDANIFGIDNSESLYDFANYTIDDLNIYYWNQNLCGHFKRYYEDQSPMNVIVYDSISGLTSFHYYYDSGNTSAILTRKHDNLTGPYISFYENGNTRATGNYSITNSRTSVKDSIWNYYYKEGLLQAAICYHEGNKTGSSTYYDQEGKLRRIEVVEKDGANYSLFDGDTVNYTDANKKKQGKWLSFPITVRSEDGGCDDNITSIKYYKDNKPTKTWTITENGRYFKTYDKEVYVWQDSSLAYYYRYFRDNNQLKSEGDIINMDYKFGLWKEYDSEKGYLKYEGNYYLNVKVGQWKIYKQNGRVKKIIDFTVKDNSAILKHDNPNKNPYSRFYDWP